MLQIMQAFASYLTVPAVHLQDRSATPSLPTDTGMRSAQRVQIHSSQDKPETAFAVVRYRDHWFWVDDGDLLTKRALTAVIFFFTLAETSTPEPLPLVTIPAQ
jgi:hypothetical protein